MCLRSYSAFEGDGVGGVGLLYSFLVVHKDVKVEALWISNKTATVHPSNQGGDDARWHVIGPTNSTREFGCGKMRNPIGLLCRRSVRVLWGSRMGKSKGVVSVRKDCRRVVVCEVETTEIANWCNYCDYGNYNVKNENRSISRPVFLGPADGFHRHHHVLRVAHSISAGW